MDRPHHIPRRSLLPVVGPMSRHPYARFVIAAALAASAASCGSREPPARPAAAQPVAAPAAAAEALRAAPTPRLADGRPDFNGTWAHAGGGVLGLDFVVAERLPDGSVCVFGCDVPEE